MIFTPVSVTSRLETATFRTQTSDRVINVPASSRSETWTLELDNGANAELKELELHASGPVYQVRFLSMKSAAPAASGETSPSGYRVFYGGSGHPMPSSEFTDALRIAKPAPVPSDSTLSEQKANPHYKEKSDIVRDWGLVYKIIMAAAALAVFVILLFSVKKIDKVEE